jgi:hypothetical protein
VKVPTFEEIELRAYDIYLKRGDGDGVALEDSLAAEKELRASRQTDAVGPLMKREGILTFGEADSWMNVLRLAALVSVRQCT